MNGFRQLALAATALSLLSACQPQGMQNKYDYTEVGKSHRVEFGTVIATREVDVKGQNSGAGALAGGVAGGVGGNMIGNGNGQLAGVLAGVAIGAVAGAMAEQAAADYKGIEYTITKENGSSLTIVQPIVKDERQFKAGDRVMIQTSGSFQRVLPTDNIPTQIKRPKGITLVD